MRLSLAETKHFFALLSAVNNFIYGKLQEAKGMAATKLFRDLPLTEQLQVREAFVTDRSYIDRLIVENPAQLSFADLELIGEWRNMITGDFYIIKHLKKYTVFLDCAEPATAYGVVGLTQDIVDVMGPEVPIMVSTVILLPFLGRLTYDGLVSRYPIHFGAGLRRTINDSYREAKARGIVEALPSISEFSTEQKPAQKPAQKRAAKRASPAKTKAPGA